MSLAGIPISGQYFGAVNQESQDFDGNPNSGVMGEYEYSFSPSNHISGASLTLRLAPIRRDGLFLDLIVW